MSAIGEVFEINFHRVISTQLAATVAGGWAKIVVQYCLKGRTIPPSLQCMLTTFSRTVGVAQESRGRHQGYKSRYTRSLTSLIGSS